MYLLFHLLFVLLGLLSGIALFARFPTLSQPKQRDDRPQNAAATTPADTMSTANATDTSSASDDVAQTLSISVIIPARNEADNLPLLLKSLLCQTVSPLEMICVDDDSTDQTKAVVESFGVRYLKVSDKPSDWTGKTFACQTGAMAASGDLLLFVDADVTLAPNALEQLRLAHLAAGKVISVQPYHAVERFYEHGAMFFNAISVAANGLACPLSKRKAGLFGPVILMSRSQFDEIGGYQQVRQSIVEDVELGRVLLRHGISYTLYPGKGMIRFRMYHSFRELVAGFAKNYAVGSTKTPLLLFFLTFFWLGGLTTAPILLFDAIGMGELRSILFAAGSYLLYVLQLGLVLREIGSFGKRYLPIFPLFLLLFHLTFLYSVFCGVFRKKVTWKGREIPLKQP